MRHTISWERDRIVFVLPTPSALVRGTVRRWWRGWLAGGADAHDPTR